MSYSRAIVAGILAVAIAQPVAATQDEQPQRVRNESETEDGNERSDVAAAGQPAPVYVPPSRQRPRRRIGGGVRGAEAQWPHVYALVPTHTGYTVSESPSLFWSIDAPAPDGAHFAFYLVRDDTDQTVVQTTLARPADKGIQRVRLADLGISLEVGVEYEWSVALEQAQTQVLVATGWIERLPESGVRPRGTPSAQDYARQGLWYDALASISDQIEASPDNGPLERVRAAFLAEQGLR